MYVRCEKYVPLFYKVEDEQLGVMEAKKEKETWCSETDGF